MNSIHSYNQGSNHIYTDSQLEPLPKDTEFCIFSFALGFRARYVFFIFFYKEVKWNNRSLSYLCLNVILKVVK